MVSEYMSQSTSVSAFLSCTSTDLHDHRQSIRERCTRQGYQIISMEEFGAQDGTALEISLKEIESCQVFIGVYAHRYGFIPPDYHKSITEAEYDEAKRLDKPRLVFVLAEGYVGYPLLEQFRDDGDPTIAAKLKAFRDRVGQERVWDYFTTPQDLARRVSIALSNWEGWRVPKAPLLPGRYIGRDMLMSQLREALTQRKSVALLGIGGIGKTYSATQLAQLLTDTFTGGVLWMTLGTEASDTKAVLGTALREWARQHPVGRITDPEELQPDLMRRWLQEAPGPLLIVLDDVWHPQPAWELLRLIPDNATLLITGRRADIASKLNITESVELQPFSESDALTMLRDRVGDIPSPAALRGIATLLGNHPLALEIAAAQILKNGADYAELLPDLLAEKLEQGTELDLLQIEGNTRQSSIEAMLSLTYDSLSSDLRRRFRALGVLAPNATLLPATLSAVWGDAINNTVEQADSSDRMNTLANNGVLFRDEDQRHYRLHSLLRTYARALLVSAGELSDTSSRYTNFVVGVADRGFRRPADEWSDLDLYLPHIHHVGDELTRCVADAVGNLEVFAQPEMPTIPPRDSLDDETYARLKAGSEFVLAVENYIRLRREIGDIGLRWYWLGLASMRILGQEMADAMLGNLGLWYNEHSQHSLALRYFEKALELVRQSGRQLAQAKVLNNMGAAYLAIGQPTHALELFEQALAVHEFLGDSAEKAVVLDNFAATLSAMGERKRALEIREQALDSRRKGNDFSEQSAALNNSARYYQDTGKLDKALKLFQQALAIAEQLGDKYAQGHILHNLAGIYHARGQPDRALEVYKRAATLLEEAGALTSAAMTLNNTAVMYLRKNQPQQALELFEQVLPIMREQQDLSGEATVLHGIGSAYEAMGQLLKALEFYHQSLTKTRNVKDTSGEVATLNNIAVVYGKLDQNDKALEHFRQVLPLVRQFGDILSQASTLRNLGWLLAFKLGRPIEGIVYMGKAIAIVYSAKLSDVWGLSVRDLWFELIAMAFLSLWQLLKIISLPLRSFLRGISKSVDWFRNEFRPH